MTNQPSAGQTPAAPDLAQQLQALLRAPVPRLYANGLGTATSAADIAVIFLTNDVPTAIINMSWTTAKSLVQDVSKMIDQFEKSSSQQVKDIATIAAEMQKNAGSN